MKWIKKSWKFFSNILSENQLRAVRTFVQEFCANSSIHGVRYFTERGRHWTERLWWITAFSLSVWLCAESIKITWTDWPESPISLNFANKPKLISDIPFPTVIVCSETKIPTHIANMTSWSYFLADNYYGEQSEYRKKYNETEMRALSNDSMEDLQYLAHLCYLDLPYRTSNFSKRDYDIIDNSIYQKIIQMFQSLSLDSTPLWRQSYETPPFTQMFSDEGVCFAFNTLNSNEIYTDEMTPELMIVENLPNTSGWNFENGYASESDQSQRIYPYRSFNTQMDFGLNFYLSFGNKSDSENFCRGRLPGYRLYVNVPGEHTIMSRKYIHIPFEEGTQVSIKSKLTTTSDSLRSYEPSARGCIFNSESHLRFFKTYTQNNCKVECLANYTYARCGCVKFSMPKNKSGTPICGWAKIRCYIEAEYDMFTEDVIDGMEEGWTKAFRQQCNCLPSCTSITYETEVRQVKVNPGHSFPNTSLYSEIWVNFGDYEITTLRRTATYTLANFLSNCGGLLGLFLGISVLSIIEFIYFGTIHLFWWIRKWRSKNAVLPFHQNDIVHISPIAAGTSQCQNCTRTKLETCREMITDGVTVASSVRLGRRSDICYHFSGNLSQHKPFNHSVSQKVPNYQYA